MSVQCSSVQCGTVTCGPAPVPVAAVEPPLVQPVGATICWCWSQFHNLPENLVPDDFQAGLDLVSRKDTLSGQRIERRAMEVGKLVAGGFEMGSELK